MANELDPWRGNRVSRRRADRLTIASAIVLVVGVILAGFLIWGCVQVGPKDGPLIVIEQAQPTSQPAFEPMFPGETP